MDAIIPRLNVLTSRLDQLRSQLRVVMLNQPDATYDDNEKSGDSPVLGDLRKCDIIVEDIFSRLQLYDPDRKQAVSRTMTPGERQGAEEVVVKLQRT